MTIPEVSHDQKGPEWLSSFTVPEYDILDTIDYAMLPGTTPLEDAFLRWLMLTNDAAEAFQKVRHPALPKVDFGVTAQDLLRRPLVKQNLKKIRLLKPMTQTYTADFILSVLHEEIQHLRLKERKQRFADKTTIQGKKSENQEELDTIETLVKCLDLARNLAKEGDNGSPNQPAEGDARSTHSGVDRVITEAQRLIADRFAKPVGSTDADSGTGTTS